MMGNFHLKRIDASPDYVVIEPEMACRLAMIYIVMYDYIIFTSILLFLARAAGSLGVVRSYSHHLKSYSYSE